MCTKELTVPPLKHIRQVRPSATTVVLQTAEEQRDRQAFSASMQQLPAGIQAQKAHPPAGVCHVCFIEDYTDDNLLIEVQQPTFLCYRYPGW